MKRPTGSRSLLVKQLVKVIDESIPRLQSAELAEQLDTQIHTLWKQGVIDDAQYQTWRNRFWEIQKILWMVKE